MVTECPQFAVSAPETYIRYENGNCTDVMERKQILSQLVSENERIVVSRYVEAEGRTLYRAADEKELEGVVAKRKESIYLMGQRTKDWIKFKRMADEEFIVAGYIQKGLHTFSLILAKYKKDVLIYQGHVTAGVTKDDVAELPVTEKSPFQMMPAGNEDAVWAKPEKVCVVEYMPSTKNALRQSVFKGYRDDVRPSDVRIEFSPM